MTYPEMPDQQELEKELLAAWEEENTFQRAQNTEGEEFVFFEGPPTANGQPGLHHLVSRTFKDLVCRFQTMLGKRVVRKAGWDTHGLPVELEAEHQLGVDTKADVEKVGLEEFQQACRSSVFTYKKDWEDLSRRVGYWLDYDDPYMTCSREYVESVWWALKELWNRELLYRGSSSLPWCPRCETGLSSHEVAQGYQDRTDPAVVVQFPVQGHDFELLAWTTAPWTLSANTGLAVDPGAQYVRVRTHDGEFLVAHQRVGTVMGEEEYKVVQKLPGKELVGLQARRPFPGRDQEGSSSPVVPVSWLDLDEGTGLVHLAPAHGPEDFQASQEHDLPVVQHLTTQGQFPAQTPRVGGLKAWEANEVVVEMLRERDRLFSVESFTHSYPHCWRCSTPLVHLARPSWYLKTSQMREEMLERNRQVSWHPPEVGEGRMGDWLEGNVDWALSRDRYWGTPLPVWTCSKQPEHVQVMGSLEELGQWSDQEVPPDFDPHRPEVDRHSWDCPREGCSGRMTRQPDVVDVWLDSGAMPFAQWGYPRTGENEFARQASADFVCEGVDQTRGWFYSLLALATLLDHPLPYKNVLVCGLLLDENGEKMSKSEGNAVDPWTALETYGADRVRWHLATSSAPWKPTRFDPDQLETGGLKMFDTLKNTYRLFRMYAELEDFQPAPFSDVQERNVLDRWLLSRLETVTGEVRSALQDMDVRRGGQLLEEFVVQDLSNWYVRRSRRRFWGVSRQPDMNAFQTLWEVLVRVSQLLAPFGPFTSDWLWRALGKQGSVHLSQLPQPDANKQSPQLEEDMHQVRQLVDLGRQARGQTSWNLRQPLPTLWVVPHGEQLDLSEQLLEHLTGELNVKEVRVTSTSELVAWEVKPDFSVLGPRLGETVKAVAGALNELSSQQVQRARQRGGLTLEVEGEKLDLQAEHLDFRSRARAGWATAEGQDFTVGLEEEVSEKLWREGARRELVSQLQEVRKELDLSVEERVRLELSLEGRLLEAVREEPEDVSTDLLAPEFQFYDGTGDLKDVLAQLDVRGYRVQVWLKPLERE